ncbi:MAG: DNA polymerase III subunit delta [Dehalobacterium sp.]|jgi:DNA polymerase-3 subunit delta
MDGTLVLKDIKRGVLAPVYLFYGSEHLLLEETLAALTKFLTPGGAQDFNYEKIDGKSSSPVQVVNAANILPVFAEKRLVVVYNVFWFSANKGEEEKSLQQVNVEPLIEYLNNPSPSTCLVLVAGEKVDGRSKVVKKIKKMGQVIEFASLRGMELNKWLEKSLRQRGKKAQPGVFDYLTLAVGNNLNALDQELEKASLFVEKEEEIKLQDVMETASVSSTLNVFNLMDTISKKDGAAAVLQLRELLRTGESERKIFYLLVRQMRILLLIFSLRKRGYQEAQIISDSGLHPYVVKKGLQQCQIFTAQELIHALEYLRDMDEKVKSGRGNVLALLEELIMRMCL